MGRFSRSVRRGVARSEGELVSRGKALKQQRQERTAARRLWCPQCKRVLDEWEEIRKAEISNGKQSLRCKQCDALLSLKRWDELPNDTPVHGLWVRLDGRVVPSPKKG